MRMIELILSLCFWETCKSTVEGLGLGYDIFVS